MRPMGVFVDINAYRKHAAKIKERLCSDPEIGRFIDETLEPPDPYGPEKNARLVILGQDPTVKREESRARVQVVLNLNRGGALRSYLVEVSKLLNLDLSQDVAAINVANNFFTAPPTTLPDPVLSIAVDHWAPLVKRQLASHPNACFISLGEPILKVVSNNGASCRVRDYWGYEDSRTPGNPALFKALPETMNKLDKIIYPFPHQPSRGRKFYAQTLQAYSRFVLQNSGMLNWLS